MYANSHRYLGRFGRPEFSGRRAVAPAFRTDQLLTATGGPADGQTSESHRRSAVRLMATITLATVLAAGAIVALGVTQARPANAATPGTISSVAGSDAPAPLLERRSR